MNSKLIRNSGTALAAVLITTPFAATAAQATKDAAADSQQSAETNNLATVEEVVVSARRRSERLLDAPVAITAVTGETLENYSVTRVSDLATLVPSLVAGKAASGSASSIFLRGVGSTALSAGFDQSVSFVIDNIPMSRGREISLPQYDIQLVEVLKGPQALFFGKNTTGGLISMVSNGPGDTFEAGAKAGYGFEAEEGYAEGFVSGPISDTLRARLAGRYSKSDGAFTNTAADSYPFPIPGLVRTRDSDQRGRSEVGSARLTLDWQPTDALSVQLKTGFTELEDGGPSDLIERICAGNNTTPASANGIPPSPNADCRIDGRSDSSALPEQIAQANYRYARDGELYADFASQYAVLNGTLSLGAFDVTSITGYYHFRQTDMNNVSGEGYPASFSQLADFDQTSQELRVQSKFDGPFNFMVGGFAAAGDFVFNTDAYIFPVPPDPITGTAPTFKRDNGFETDSFSLFAEGTYNITQTLELSAGARYSDESRDSFQRSLPANGAFAAAFPGGIFLQDTYEDTDVSPQVTLRYKPSVDTTIYAAYKEGFKAGGFNISQTLTPASTVQVGRYGAETAQGGELGLRALLGDRRLSLNTTVYHYVYSDLQVQFFDPATISLTAGNAGKLRTQGVEADFNFLVLEGLSLRGAAAYNDAEFQDYIGQCYVGQTIAAGCDQQFANGAFNAQDYDGRRPPKAPRFAGRLGATYEIALGASGMSLRLSSDVSRTSSYNFSDALRPDAVQEAYTKVDASVALVGQDERWTVSVIGRNLSDEQVVTAANDIPFAGGTGTGTDTGVLADMSAFVDNPREVYLEVGYKF